MIAATVCSGIGAPEVAMPHWQWVLASEIEAAPRAVMAYRHGAEDARHARMGTGPALWGDFTAIRVRFLRRHPCALPSPPGRHPAAMACRRHTVSVLLRRGSARGHG